MAAIDPLASLNSLMASSSGGAAAAEAEEAVAELDQPHSLTNPVVVATGATEWDKLGDVKQAALVKATSLFGPTKMLGALADVKVSRVISGPSASHTIALTDAGVFVWGKNHMGQLGLGDEMTRPGPVELTALSGETIIHAAAGKGHSLFVTASGKLYACGCNKFGAVGPAPQKKKEFVSSPVQVAGVPYAVRCSAGADFSMVIDRSGSVWSFGWSEFGQLGMGTDGSYNTSASSVKMTFEAERNPSRVPGLSNVVQLVCGPHHTVALTSAGVCYTWGRGAYGTLGHDAGQDDVWAPRQIQNFLFRSINAGGMWCTGIGWRVYNGSSKPQGGGMLHMWGRINPTKDSWMYPKPEYELQGWNISALSCGNNHVALFADDSVIVWGTGCQFGELGFGEGGPKSSAKPKQVDGLQGSVVGDVTCGVNHTVYIVEQSQLTDDLPEWVAPEPVPPEPKAEGKGKGKGKRAAPAAKGKAKKTKK